ncbi:MAG: hypothetical protein IT174_00565 [Acidobacteria bacterium]|nr:hypothetical protein [Acidobacteriota bacterium]
MLTVIIVGGIALFVGFLIKTFVYKQDPTKSLYGESAPSIVPDDEASSHENIDAQSSPIETNKDDEQPHQLSVGVCVLASVGITIGLITVLFLLGQDKAAAGAGAPVALISYITLRRGFSFFPRL